MKTNLSARSPARVFSMPLVCGTFLFALIGCGGGGGGSGGGSGPSAITTSPAIQSASVPVSGAAQNAAGNLPKEDSITQSSNGAPTGDGTTTTTDKVEITGLERSSSGYDFTVTKSGEGATGWKVTHKNDVIAQFDDEGNFDGFELAKRVNVGSENAGWVIVDFYTDIEEETTPADSETVDTVVATPDSDWLAGGVWLYIKDDAASVDDIEIGAFGDGRDPFTMGNIGGLTGTATYTGSATGIYTEEDGTVGKVGYFDADARLTANFDGTSAASPLGTIGGSITNFIVDGQSYEGKLDLDSASITNTADGGFFTGNTSSERSADEGVFTGKWGGQFFGNGDNANDHPGSVVGTFGGTNEGDTGADESTVSFVGVFGADLN